MRARSLFALLAGVLILPPFALTDTGTKSADPAPSNLAGAHSPKLRVIEFDTDEGTWMSLDVSPDGSTIVFDLLGQLYQLPIAGGTAKRISHGDGFFSQPRYSPSGQIVYVSDVSGAENVWVAEADGASPRQLTKEEHDLFVSPVWTADGKSVLVSRQDREWGTLNLWSYAVSSGASTALTTFPAERSKPPEDRKAVLGPAAAPDGRYVYFSQSLKAVPHDAMLPLWQIVRLDLARKKGTLFLEAPGSAFRPALSPDGSRLVYGTRHGSETGLRLCDLATGESRWLVSPIDRDEQESIAPSRDILPGYAFTPDGQSLIASWGGKIRRVDLRDGRQTVIPFRASISQPVRPILRTETRWRDEPRRIRLILDPEKSPDGRLLAFSALARIYLYETDGNHGKPRRMTAGMSTEFQPRWSPDGRWIAYVSWTNERGGHIWMARAHGGGSPVQMTVAPAYYRDVVWSPDGSKLAALSSPRQMFLEKARSFDTSTPLANTDLILIPAEGGEAQVIAPAPGYLRPHFGASADRLYVTTPDGLASMLLDGSDLRVHLKVDDGARGRFSKHSRDKSVVVSPDQRHALTALGHRLHLFTLPDLSAKTEKPLTVGLDSPPDSVSVKTVSRIGSDSFGWANGGESVTWSLGSTFFERATSRESSAPKETLVPLEFEPYRPDTTVVFQGARVVTMGPEGVLESADVVVRGNRITGVTRAGTKEIPEARVVPAEGMTILPGLIESHGHFHVSSSILELSQPRFTAALAYGITTVRDPQSSTATLLAYQDLLDAGSMAGPRVFTTGPGILSGSGVVSQEDALALLRKYKVHYRTEAIKNYVAGNRQQRRWLVEACRQLGLMATNEGASDLKLELTQAIDGFTGNEHSFGTFPLYNDVIQLLVRSGIYTTFTLTLGYGGPLGYHYFIQDERAHSEQPAAELFYPPGTLPRQRRQSVWFGSEEFIFPRQAAVARTIARSGGAVSLGTDLYQGLPLHWSMWAATMGGLTPLEVLGMTTIEAARILGYAQDLGSIEPGKLADLVVLSKNPLEDIHNTTAIRYVMRNGELFDAETMDRILPTPKKRPVPWWIADEPRNGIAR